MSTNNRDDFTKKDKQTLAERVAWKCSFPGCGRITVGPDSNDQTKKVNVGEAAHIHAASPGGPRPNPHLKPEERKHISNGIWMCRHHAALIDADYAEYSASTLRDWKSQAEKRAADSLKFPVQKADDEDATLIQLGSGIIYFAFWNSIHSHKWSFTLIAPLKGSEIDLQNYIMEFGHLSESESYVVIEKQGDARKILDIKIEIDPNGRRFLLIDVDKKPDPTNPNELGRDIKLDDTGNIAASNGNIDTVEGVDTAKQMLSICMSTVKGEMLYAPEHGSLATDYYNIYKNDLELFSRLILLELVRLSLIPLRSIDNSPNAPSLHFVKRMLSVHVYSTELVSSRFKAHLKLEWGNGEVWEGVIPIFVQQT